MNRPTTEVLLSAQEVSRSYGSQPVLDNVSLSLHAGERLGLIGRNGTGKSTLLHILAGDDEPDSGEVTRKAGLSVALLSQECRLDRSLTVRQALARASQPLRDLAARHAELSEQLHRPGLELSQRDQLVADFDRVDHDARVHDVWSVDAKTDRIAAALGLPEGDRVLETLSGGELRRVDLAVTLLADPDVLLLDEPTNHIDTESARWIEDYLARYEGSCILVTHDRYFLDRVVTRIAEIDRRRLLTFPGNYERFLEYKTQVAAIDARTETNRQAELKRELAWLRRGPKARGTKQKARIQRYEELADKEVRPPDAELVLEIPTPRRLGKRVIEAERIAAEKDGRVLFDDFTLILQSGMRVGIAGPNGCGKTTLLRILMGQEKPAQGAVFIGDSVDFLYVDQAHEDIDPGQSVLDYVSGGANYRDVDGRRVYVPGYLERLLFDMDSVRSPIRNLSGGERNRMCLAKKLLQGGNLLVLDEPTNDLDLATLRVLEEAVLAFDGASLIVSHDRYFLNRVATHLIVFEPGEPLYFSAGDYDDYVRYRGQRDAHRKTTQAPETPQAKTAAGTTADDDAPKRLTYKEQQELEGMEASIESLDAQIAELESAVNESDFYQRPHEDVQRTLNELSKKKKALEELYMRWEHLEARAGIK